MPKRKQDRDGIYRRKDSPYWWASYIDATGRRARRSTGTADRREAEAVLAQWRLEARQERVWGVQPSRSFDELMLGYLREVTPQKRAPERDRYSARALYGGFSGMYLDALTPADVRRYAASRREEGAAAGTINRELGLLSSALNYARREWGWDVTNPVPGRRQREPEGRIRWINPEEADRLITVAREERQAPHLADFIQLALHTGMRRGELLGLEWGRVDLQAGLVHLEARHTKAGKRRSVPLNQPAKDALTRRLQWRADNVPGARWVFCDREGERIQSVKRSFSTACRRAGIRDFRVHDLRHTCAAWLVTAGVPLPEVRDLLGHGSITMTERYAHLAPENVRAAVSRLEEQSVTSEPPGSGGKSRSSHAGLRVIEGNKR